MHDGRLRTRAKKVELKPDVPDAELNQDLFPPGHEYGYEDPERINANRFTRMIR